MEVHAAIDPDRGAQEGDNDCAADAAPASGHDRDSARQFAGSQNAHPYDLRVEALLTTLTVAAANLICRRYV
jgi:hypothetical protein